MELDKDTMEQLSTLVGNVLGDYYNYYGKDIVDVECTLSNKLSDSFIQIILWIHCRKKIFSG